MRLSVLIRNCALVLALGSLSISGFSESLKQEFKDSEQKFEDDILQFRKDLHTENEQPADKKSSSPEEKAEDQLKEGVGNWIWSGHKIYEDQGPLKLQFISLLYNKPQNGAQIRVYVTQAQDGTISLQSNLVFSKQSDIKQNTSTNPRTAKISGRFDTFPEFEKTIPKITTFHMIFSFQPKDGFLAGGDQHYSAIWMLLNSKELTIKFNSDLFAYDSGNLRTAVFNLDGLQEMIYRALTVLGDTNGRTNDPKTLVNNYLNQTGEIKR